jgi:FkbM family methyltransferase
MTVASCSTDYLDGAHLSSLADREAQWAQLGQSVSIVGVEIDGVTYFVHTRDHEIGRRLYTRGYFERLELTRAVEAAHAIDPRCSLDKRILLDLGAHVGSAGLTACRYLGASGVYAVEALHSNFRLLQANMANNNISAVLEHCALADTDDGVAWIEVSGNNTGNNYIYAYPAEDRIQVTTRTLDSLVDDGTFDLEQVGFCVLDVERSEPLALTGGRHLLAAKHVPLMMEYCPSEMHPEWHQRMLVDLMYAYGRVMDLRNPDSFWRPIHDLPRLQREILPDPDYPGGPPLTDLLFVH